MKQGSFLHSDCSDVSDSEMPECVRKRKEYLEKIIRDKEAALVSPPKGHLRAVENKGYHEYYLRMSPEDPNGRYMTRQERGIAKQLAQRDYDAKLLKAAKKECFAAANYLRVIENNSITELYERLSEGRRALVEPIRLPDAEFIKFWLSEEYEPFGFEEGASEYYSDSGLRVRSKSEIIIANLLEKYEVPYKYECPLKLDKWGTVRPDFTCRSIRISSNQSFAAVCYSEIIVEKPAWIWYTLTLEIFRLIREICAGSGKDNIEG